MKDIVKRLPESTDKCQYCGSCRLVRPSGKWQFNCECDNPEKRPKKPKKENRMKDFEKLKDKNYVRPFGLMKPEERECFEEIGPKHCLIYMNDWDGDLIGGFGSGCTYAIKPEYKPKPETVDLKIKSLACSNFGNQDMLWLGVLSEKPFLPFSFTHLHCLPSLPNFEGFYLKDGDEVSVEYEWVARYFPNVIARFRI